MRSLAPEVLRRRGGVKWTRHGEDVLPAWVAEMDFPVAVEIVHAVREATERELFGYAADQALADLAAACAGWLGRAHGWAVDPEDVHVVPDALRGVELGVALHSPAGSPVILPTPAYPPLFEVIAQCGRPVVEAPMTASGRPTLDLDAVAAAFAAGARTLLLCNPHNPLGTVATADELAALCAVVDHHGGRVVADEVHAPLTYAGHRHVPYASVSPTAAAHTVTVTSASKGWNLPGLKCAQVVVSNPADRLSWSALPKLRTWGASTLGVIAGTAAFRHGGPWLADVRAHLVGNRDLLATLLADLLPRVVSRPAEGTCLAWLDFRAIDLPAEPAEFFLSEARVALAEGRDFGAPGHARLTFATSRPVLARMVQAMAAAAHLSTPPPVTGTPL
ncbi:MalY/PatB family protein [Actinokineospora iranica]|uniref:cysteine-S-conjugate beta-lyase n=1 Tax=Actinokineospora iranica TaxID=1271860 RepID=A0A1G6U2A7_9PSEU|nr:aminotransferase class I/II-fold pyridoxal phosphate-dependent enzyme [Actinokineospora iranica]SDD34685.1 cystathione beta-lyase [Actinokineospora iranica]